MSSIPMMKSLSILCPTRIGRQMDDQRSGPSSNPDTIGAMSLERVDFPTQYARLSEAELMTLAHQYDELAGAAQDALRSEFASRKLEPPLIEDDEEPVARKLVTLRQYRDLSEAIVARSMLEAAGIVVYLRDENLVRLDWQVSNFIGGIRLQVDRADADAASELLSQPVPEFILMEGEPDFSQPHCPHCGSVEITFQGADRTLPLSSLFVLGVPLPAGMKTWLCSACGTKWEDDG